MIKNKKLSKDFKKYLTNNNIPLELKKNKFK